MTSVLHADSTRPPGAPAAGRHRPRSRRRWELPAVLALLAGTAALYLWNLTSSGYANSYYAAAVQAGTQDWTALFFGSLDAGNAITVDKPPASLWVMALSGRIYGFSSASMLVPQALMGVAAVALLWAAVRRVAGPGAGLLAAAALALTPVAALMFRFNNPDALLVLLMVAAAYCVTRAIEKAGTRWLVLAGLLIGFAFLAKMLQAFLVVPGLALAYLWAAPTGIGKRIRDVVLAGVGIVVGAGWWLLAVALWPVESRPYIGGSTDNSPLELAFGYNGLSRIFGGSRGGGGFGGGEAPSGGAAFPGGTVPDGAAAYGTTPGGALPDGAAAYGGTGTDLAGAFPGGGMPGGGGGPGGGFGGEAGLTRLFNASFGTQVSWLLPAALILAVVAFVLVRRAPRTDRLRAALLLWGGWTLVTAVTFSLMSGIIHPYYTVALAPGIAALVGIGGRQAWLARGSWLGRGALALTTAVTAVWAWVMLGWSPEFLPWLRWVILAVGVAAAVAFLLPGIRGRVGAVVAAAAVLSALAAPAAYAVQTASTAHTGSIPSAGPTVEGASDFGGTGGPGGRFSRGGSDGARADQAGTAEQYAPGQSASGQYAPSQGTPDGQGGGTAGGFPAGGGPGGPGGTEQVDAALVTLLQEAGDTRWAAATTGAQSAASLELASGTSVMAMGGFSGSDAYPTLEQFQQYVADGEIHYFVTGGMGGGPGGRSNEISTWVEQNFGSTTVGGQTVYDLTAPLG